MSGSDPITSIVPPTISIDGAEVRENLEHRPSLGRKQAFYNIMRAKGLTDNATPKSPACFPTSAIARPHAEAGRPNRSAARCLAFSASSSRLRGDALVSSRLMRRCATSNTRRPRRQRRLH